MTLIGLIVSLIVFGLVMYLVRTLPIDAVVKRVVEILVILVFVLYLLRSLGWAIF